MKDIIRFCREQIENQISELSKKGNLRFLINELPSFILDSFYEEVSGLTDVDIPYIIIDSDSSYIYDDGPIDEPIKVKEDSLNRARTKLTGNDLLIVFTTPQKVLPGTIETAIITLNAIYENVESELLSLLLNGNEEEVEISRKCILELARKNSNQSGVLESDSKWRILFDLEKASIEGSSDNFYRIQSKLGFISGTNSENFKLSRNISSSIASESSDIGFSNFISELIVKNENYLLDNPSIREALDDFHDYISSSDSIVSIKSNPYLSYSNDFTSWWKVLNVNVWLQLLGEEAVIKEIFNIKSLNHFSKHESPLTYLYESNINLECIPNETEADWYVNRDLIVNGSQTCSIEANIIPSNLGSSKVKAVLTDNSKRKQVTIFSFSNNSIPIYVIIPSASKYGNRKYSSDNSICEQNIDLNGQGEHDLNLFCSDLFSLVSIIGFDISSTDDEEVEINIPSPRLIENTTIRIYSLGIFSDEECRYEFTLKDKDGHHKKLVIHLRTSESKSVEVNSVYASYVSRNLQLKSTANPSIAWPFGKLYDLEQNIVKKANSFLPVICTLDFFEFDLKNSDNLIYSNYTYHSDSDIRLLKEEHIPSISNLINLRKRVIEQLNLLSKSDIDNMLIEMLDLTEFTDQTILLINKYVDEYISLLNDPEKSDAVKWFDLTVLMNSDSDNTIGVIPLGIFLNPTHPLCLGWQLNAQLKLRECISKGKKCPVAGLLEPFSSPSVWNLLDKNYNTHSFISIKSNYDYWRIYWNESKLDILLKDTDPTYTDLLSELNIKYSVLETGLNKNQVVRSLNHTKNLFPATNFKRVTVVGDNDYSGQVNDGILEWVTQNETIAKNSNDFRELANDYASYGLGVYDLRKNSLKPESDKLHYANIEQNQIVRWFDREPEVSDLAIISNLKMQNRSFRHNEDVTSILSMGSLFRYDLQLCNQNKSITRSLVSNNQERPSDNLDGSILTGCSIIEKDFYKTLKKNSLHFVPETNVINKSLDTSRLCAISSSMLDASFIISGTDRTLWEFDLPTYGGANSNDGYYLVSNYDDSAFDLFRSRVHQFDSSLVGIDDALLSKYFKALISHGFITLKKFNEGGAAAVGEIGVLVAHLLMQPFKDIWESDYKGLCVSDNDKALNLLIPADPFQERIDKLKEFMDYGNLNRPDYFMLTVFSDSIFIDALEVKCRKDTMPERELFEAQKKQSTDGIQFLSELYNYNETSLWKMAFPSLLCEMIINQINVRIANNEIPSSKLTYIAEVLNKLHQGKIKIEFSDQGKVISISDRNTSRLIESNILALSKNDIISVLNQDMMTFFNQVINLDHSTSWSFGLATEKPVGEGQDLKKPSSSESSTKGKTHFEVQEKTTKEKTNKTNDDLDKKHRKNIDSYKLSESILEQKYKIILATLDEHSISVDIPMEDKYIEGPAFILFNVIPKSGIKIKKIEGILDELKLNLKLEKNQHIKIDVNRGVVNIVVPKLQNERYFIDAEKMWDKWKPNKEFLQVPIGEDMLGDIVTLNFSSSNTPHILIGGQTGSGKSEALNTILHGLINYYSPEEVKFILVDPKGTELQMFENSEFLFHQIGFDDEDALEYLSVCVEEMQKRYKLMKAQSVRNISDYNNKVAKNERLAWWLVVLDEYGDLTASKEAKVIIEEKLTRLAQKARACGIHLIVTTQNPNAQVISSNVRSNLGAQLALRVRGSIESKIILTESGAETLNGKGDAILNSGEGKKRLQVARVKMESEF